MSEQTPLYTVPGQQALLPLYLEYEGYPALLADYCKTVARLAELEARLQRQADELLRMRTALNVLHALAQAREPSSATLRMLGQLLDEASHHVSVHQA